ncbi:hypothetical protein [Massilia glaciei]|uniref:HEAT repeat domain-containing protein n=1 Tax=Massilia glaciei TaxID=1524097 RepID=A0A2U2HJR1_9BURK|nr:hypothetical protein [Massilia glaciei]PWF47713.1 hypothetical protein C7C56_014195 [Massilia glaciei]
MKTPRVPRAVRIGLLVVVAAQLLWRLTQAPPAARAAVLQAPPSLPVLRLMAMGEPIALSKLLMLGVQGHDDQAGISIALRALDYGVLRAWLERIVALDPRAQYPLLAASQVYAAVDDPARVRVMLDFVYESFGADPERRWPALAHAALVARHRLHDHALARKYAAAIRTRARGPAVPAWARALEAIMLEDMNELDSAKLLIGGLVHDGLVSDPRELTWLSARLEAISARQQAQEKR